MEIQNRDSKIKGGESFQHLKIKRYLMKNLPQSNEIKKLREEVIIGNRIADIFCELINGKKVVIEVQHSMILSKEIINRTKDYTQNNCHVLWVFNASSFDRLPKNETGIRILNFERTCQKIYRGRVYYVNAINTGSHSPLYPLYFNTFHEEKSLPVGFEYYRKSRSKKNIVLGDLDSLKLKLFKNWGLLLAGFYDINVRDHCFNDIIEFLQDQSLLANLIVSITDLADKQKLLCALTGAFGERYGVDLIYDVLRQRIKIDINGKDLHIMKSFYNHKKNKKNNY